MKCLVCPSSDFSRVEGKFRCNACGIFWHSCTKDETSREAFKCKDCQKKEKERLKQMYKILIKQADDLEKDLSTCQKRTQCVCYSYRPPHKKCDPIDFCTWCVENCLKEKDKTKPK